MFFLISKCRWRVVHTVGRAHRSDLLPAGDQLAFPYEHRVQMSVEAIDHLHRAAFGRFPIRVAHDDHVAPADMDVAREHNDPITDGIDRIAQIRIAATVAIPVFAQVPVGRESARFVVSDRVRPAHREIETIRHPDRRGGGTGLVAAIDRRSRHGHTNHGEYNAKRQNERTDTTHGRLV